MILKALAMQALGDTKQGGIALAESLALAEPGGYVRVFVDEGYPMQSLLRRWLSHPSHPSRQARADDSPQRGYAAHLLSQFDVEPHVLAAAHEKHSPASSLVEPLSPRELEVLHLIAMGRTNQEIAQELIVSPGTVKAHTASIYRKLDVAHRTEAVARARELNILP